MAFSSFSSAFFTPERRRIDFEGEENTRQVSLDEGSVTVNTKKTHLVWSREEGKLFNSWATKGPSANLCYALVILSRKREK